MLKDYPEYQAWLAANGLGDLSHDQISQAARLSTSRVVVKKMLKDYPECEVRLAANGLGDITQPRLSEAVNLTIARAMVKKMLKEYPECEVWASPIPHPARTSSQAQA